MLHKVTLYIQSVFKRICRRQEGIAAVEYALVLPLFLTITIGGFELGNIYMVNASLEGAVTQATRTAMTGAVPVGYINRSDYIEDIILANLEDVGVTTGITVTMNVYDSFGDIGEPEPYVDQNGNSMYDVGECYSDINDNGSWDDDMGSSGAGGEENIVVMTVDVNLPYLTGFMEALMGGSTSSTELSATTVIRNEPFGGVAWEPSSNVVCT